MFCVHACVGSLGVITRVLKIGGKVTSLSRVHMVHRAPESIVSNGRLSAEIFLKVASALVVIDRRSSEI